MEATQLKTIRDYEAEAKEAEAFLLARGCVGNTLMELLANYNPLKTTSLPTSNLSDDQIKALEKLEAWFLTTKPTFILKGFAGTGKSFLMGTIANSGRENLFFSATTNKAAKVLGTSIGRMTKTIYSLLGLRMVEEEEELILKQVETPPYFPRGSIIIIDEASMVGTKLLEVIQESIKRLGLRVIYVGDPAQLPPIGEARSPAWRLTQDEACISVLRKVMRNDNELLALATRIRSCIRDSKWINPIIHDIDEYGIGGVWVWRSKEKMERHLLSKIGKTDFRDTKVIAWRNREVLNYNNLIRNALGYTKPYEIGDILLLAEPIEKDGQLIAHTDDEYKVVGVEADDVILDNNARIPTWNLKIEGELNLSIQVPRSDSILNSELSNLASVARRAKGKERADAWKEFWNAKRKFQNVRYGYALTAHRAQGSSYNTVYVDSQDILSNPTKREAYRCLYVACTRSTEAIHTF